MSEVTRDPQRAADILRAGGLVAFPTETVYGLGALARDERAVGRIFAAKGRPPTHPLIVHLAEADELERWAAAVPDVARRLVAALWPGPLTLIVAARDDVPRSVTGGRATVGVRVPGHPVALELLRLVGGGVAAPSANRFGRVSTTRAEHVVDELGERVDLVLDGGACSVGVESTIVDVTGATPEILRPGGVSAEVLADLLGVEPARWHGEGDARAPGMLASHYAPSARVRVVDDEAQVPVALAALAEGADAAELNVGVLAGAALPTDALEAAAATGVDLVELEPAGDAAGFARVLYDRLRQVDRLALDAVVVVAPPDEGVGVAVRDRLARAQDGRPHVS